MRWPGLGGRTQAGRVDAASHYHIDVAATVLELLDLKVPSGWDGRSFAPALREGRDEGRDSHVLSQGAWTCQRSVRFDDYIFLRTLHDGYHDLPDAMLFDLASDPHEQHDLAAQLPKVVEQANHVLERWHAEQMQDHVSGIDPMATALDEGGPWHVKGHLAKYLERLRATGREDGARRLEAQYPQAARA